MSASAQDSTNTTKAVVSDAKNGEAPKDEKKPAAQLEEDDEFEDFPVEGILLLGLPSLVEQEGGRTAIDWRIALA